MNYNNEREAKEQSTKKFIAKEEISGYKDKVQKQIDEDQKENEKHSKEQAQQPVKS